MKTRTRLFILAMAASVIGCNETLATDLYISEYIEGSSHNKAIEIYNGTGASVDMSSYSIAVYFNGKSSASTNVSLSGTLADGDVFVLAHSSATQEIINVADQTYGGSFYNGDDAVALLKDGVSVDVIGQIGFDPGQEWGTGLTSTKDNTLRRMTSVTDGRADGSTAFDPSAEWEGYAKNTFDDLGTYAGSNGGGGGGGGTASCGEPATALHEVQGDGANSPLNNQTVVVEGIVVGDFQNTTTELKGFHLQEESADQDANPATSEGAFVQDNGFGVDVALGDLVRVAGTVKERHGQTQLETITAVDVCSSGHQMAATSVQLPLASGTHLERFEGMLVEFSQTLTVTDNYNLFRYGEFILSSGGRLFTPTNVVLPGTAASNRQAENDLNQILVDDASTVQNSDPTAYPGAGLSADNTLRIGDTVTGLKGVMGYGFSRYRVQPVQEPVFTAANARTLNPSLPNQGSLKVTSFNVLNYFNGDGQGGGFPTSRGADSAVEFERQRNKIISAIDSMDADIVGLMEIENDGYGTESAIQDLVDGLNAISGNSYAFVDPGMSQLGSDQIAVGILYRTNTVSLIGSTATTADFPFDNKNRQPLAQSFRETATGKAITIVVNHFKSKGGCPRDGSANEDQGDGQACWNAKRLEASEALVSWLNGNPTGVGANDQNRVLILGDLNAYAMEDPVMYLENNGYRNLIKEHVGASSHSYVFRAQSGNLDHALASTAIADAVSGVAEWHINGDEPRALDYNVEFKSPGQVNSLYSTSAYRSSDHDPVVVELNMGASNP